MLLLYLSFLSTQSQTLCRWHSDASFQGLCSLLYQLLFPCSFSLVDWLCLLMINDCRKTGFINLWNWLKNNQLMMFSTSPTSCPMLGYLSKMLSKSTSSLLLIKWSFTAVSQSKSLALSPKAMSFLFIASFGSTNLIAPKNQASFWIGNNFCDHFLMNREWVGMFDGIYFYFLRQICTIDLIINFEQHCHCAMHWSKHLFGWYNF